MLFRSGHPNPAAFAATKLFTAYRLAFSGAAPNFGLASAVAVVIFALVAIQALPGFRATKSLEEVQ